MAPLPMTITAERTNAFYLRKHGSAGSEAICYLPAFNAWIRDRYRKKGYRILSEASGDFDPTSEDQLTIRPPSDETIDWMRTQLESRVGDDDARMLAEIDQTKEAMEDAEGTKEKALYRKRLTALKRERARVGSQIPTVEQAKSFFIRVYRKQLRAQVSPELLASMARLSEDQNWASVEAQLNEIMRVQAEQAEPVNTVEPRPNLRNKAEEAVEA